MKHISNIFGQQFSIHISGNSSLSHDKSYQNKEIFLDQKQALQFLRKLIVPTNYWRRIDHSIGLSRHNGSQNDIENSIAAAVVQGRISFSRVNTEQLIAGKDAPLIKDAFSKTYSIVTENSIGLSDKKHILSFATTDAALSFLESSNIPFSIQNSLLTLNKNISEKDS